MDGDNYANPRDMKRKDAKRKDRHPDSARNIRNTDNDLYQYI